MRDCNAPAKIRSSTLHVSRITYHISHITHHVSHSLMKLVANSPAMQKVAELIERVATTGSNVLVLGESGSGKDATARLIHDRSLRRDRPFVKIDCAALPEDLL